LLHSFRKQLKKKKGVEKRRSALSIRAEPILFCCNTSKGGGKKKREKERMCTLHSKIEEGGVARTILFQSVFFSVLKSEKGKGGGGKEHHLRGAGMGEGKKKFVLPILSTDERKEKRRRKKPVSPCFSREKEGSSRPMVFPLQFKKTNKGGGGKKEEERCAGLDSKKREGRRGCGGLPALPLTS